MYLYPSPDIDIKVIKQIGDYSLGTELGSGAFGKVVLGKHMLTNELVAIKILDKIILNNTPDDYQSVKQEINKQTFNSFKGKKSHNRRKKK